MPDDGLAVARALGVEPGEHRARLLVEEQVRKVGLVQAIREHRSALVELLPRAARRAFSLTESANIARVLPLGDSAGRLASVVEVAMSLRGAVEHLDERALDVVDPYRHGSEFHEVPAAQLKLAVAATSRSAILDGR